MFVTSSSKSQQKNSVLKTTICGKQCTYENTSKPLKYLKSSEARTYSIFLAIVII